MSTFKSSNVIEILEVNGNELSQLNRLHLTISNHWNRRKFVVLEIDGKEYTVEANQLSRAIDNAQNAHSC